MTKKPNPSELILLGVVVGVIGLKGDLRIKSFTATKKDVAAYGLLWDKYGQESYRIRIMGENKGDVIARIDGITNRTKAEALKGLELFIPRKALPKLEENEFYYSDLIGLEVVSSCGDLLGTVSNVDNFGAGDVLEITGGAYKGLMVPFEAEVVTNIDFRTGILTLAVPDGLLGKPTDGAKV